MIKIGKKEAFYGYIDVILAQIANIIVLPIILNKVSTEEYALWNVFVSIQVFALLFESGFAVLVARFTTYAMSGAENIPRAGKPEIHNERINYRLLYAILEVAKKIYIRISVIATIVLFLATGYIYYIARELPSIIEVIVAWALFSVGIILSLYFTYYTSFLKGAGRIKEMRIISISSNILQAFLKVLFILSGFGLLGISLAVTIVIIYRRLIIRRHVWLFFNGKSKGCYNITSEFKEQLENAFKSNAKQLGLVVIAQYIENQGTTLVCSAFLPLSIIGRYGLTLQILGVISSVASIPTSTYQPVLNQAVVQNDNKRSQYIYSALTVIIASSYWIGVLMASIVVPSMLVFIKSKTMIISGYIFALMAFYQFEIIMHQRATKLISYSNDQRYFKSYIITAAVELLSAGVALWALNGNLLLYVLFLVMAELFNFIIWPNRAYKLIGYNVKGAYIQGTRNVISNIYRSLKRWGQKN